MMLCPMASIKTCPSDWTIIPASFLCCTPKCVVMAFCATQTYGLMHVDVRNDPGVIMTGRELGLLIYHTLV